MNTNFDSDIKAPPIGQKLKRLARCCDDFGCVLDMKIGPTTRWTVRNAGKPITWHMDFNAMELSSIPLSQIVSWIVAWTEKEMDSGCGKT